MTNQKIDWYEVAKQDAKRYRKAKALAKKVIKPTTATSEPKRRSCGCLPWEGCSFCHWRLEEY